MAIRKLADAPTEGPEVKRSGEPQCSVGSYLPPGSRGPFMSHDVPDYPTMLSTRGGYVELELLKALEMSLQHHRDLAILTDGAHEVPSVMELAEEVKAIFDMWGED